jgi:hypothetical protein
MQERAELLNETGDVIARKKATVKDVKGTICVFLFIL